MMDINFLSSLFGDWVRDKNVRESSYGLLETFVTSAPQVDGRFDTDAAVLNLQQTLKRKSNQELAFLVLHSGFIPDHYSHDGSEETLYTKFVEVVVAEWGSRIGFKMTLQKEKSSKEDVTFELGNRIAVCDVKSYRLGRSQKAPNVKDTIKQGDYMKWLRAYKSFSPVGGLVTFPSAHDWQGKSDVYSYVSDHSSPILLLFYEHLAFLLIKKGNSNGASFFEILNDYKSLFKDGHSKSRADYWTKIHSEINRITSSTTIDAFMDQTKFVVHEVAKWSAEKLVKRIENSKAEIEKDIANLSPEELKSRLFESEFELRTGQYSEQLKNIVRFRLK